MSENPLLAIVDRIYVINLAFRTDRRAEMAQQLARVGLSFDHVKVTLLAASRPDDPGEFPNIGARGCFESHMRILQDAQDQGHETILILEDDADFTTRFCAGSPEDAGQISSADWDMFFLGSVLDRPKGNADFCAIAPDQTLKLTHAMMLRRRAIDRLIPYFQAMLGRKMGDAQGGPMHVDGAYSWFRRDNPDVQTLATTQQWIIQRSSKTDIHPPGWKEKIPGINLARRIKNKIGQS